MAEQQQRKRKTIPNTFSVNELDALNIVLLDVYNSTPPEFVVNIRKTIASVSAPSEDSIDAFVRWDILDKVSKLRSSFKFRSTEELMMQVRFNGEVHEDTKLRVLREYATEQKDPDETKLIIQRFNEIYATLYVRYRGAMLSNLIGELTSNTYTNFNGLMGKLEGELQGTLAVVKKVNEDLDTSHVTEVIGDGSVEMENTFSRMDKHLSEESHTLRSGLKLFDRMTNGGFEAGRLYMVMGLPKGWKSGFMLNAAIWAKRYNKLKARKPGLRPGILYLTLENNAEETTERIWSHCFGNDSNYTDYDSAAHSRMLTEEGIFPRTKEEPVFMYIYRPSKSVTANDLDAIIDNYASTKGIEIRFLVIDYIKHMHSIERYSDLRIELGAIAMDLKNLAVKYDIPILTGMQFNREAMKAFDENEVDFGNVFGKSSKLNGSYVGESIDLVQNVDFAFSVIKTGGRISETKYKNMLTVTKLASRLKNDGKSNFKSFSYNFVDGNTMRLEEDTGLATVLGIDKQENMVSVYKAPDENKHARSNGVSSTPTPTPSCRIPKGRDVLAGQTGFEYEPEAYVEADDDIL